MYTSFICVFLIQYSTTISLVQQAIIKFAKDQMLLYIHIYCRQKHRVQLKETKNKIESLWS